MNLERTKNGISSIEKLSDVCLLRIFEHLPIADRFRIERGNYLLISHILYLLSNIQNFKANLLFVKNNRDFLKFEFEFKYPKKLFNYLLSKNHKYN